MNSPKVSICIPTYNYANYIAETIESVLCQTYSDFELLIVDDCSKDNTSEIIEFYARKDTRIKFIVNTINLGMVENWNSCLSLARGEYIKFVFGDDLLASPDAIERMVSLLDSNDAVSLVCSARNIIDKSSQVKQIASHFDTGLMSGSDVINYCLTKQKNLIGEPSVVMFRKCQAERGFNSAYIQIVDLEMWFYLLEQGMFAYINEPLCSFRIHSQQQTEKNSGTVADRIDVIRLLDDFLDHSSVTLSNIVKSYLKYDSIYDIWKLHKNHRISRHEAIDLINLYSNYSYFRRWYPIYKLAKPFYKKYKKYISKPVLSSKNLL